MNAAVALGNLKDQKAIQPLIQALQDENATVRSLAAHSLGELNDISAEEPLTQALKDEDASVRYEASEALKRSIRRMQKTAMACPRSRQQNLIV